MGVKLVKKLDPAHVMHRTKGDDERIDYFFVVDEWKGELNNSEPEKCSEIKWFDQSSLPEEIIPYIRFAWEQISNNQLFSEFEER